MVSYLLKPVRKLRSADMDLLAVPPNRTTLADPVSSHAAHTVWNALSPTLTSRNNFSAFKKALKTYLYQLAHDT